MNDNELLDCLFEQIESTAETLNFIQNDNDCSGGVKKVLTNQISTLAFCLEELEMIKELIKVLKEHIPDDGLKEITILLPNILNSSNNLSIITNLEKN